MSFCVPDRLHLLRGAVTAVYKETCTYRASTNNLVFTILNGTFDWSLSSTLEGFGRALCVRLVKIKCLKRSEHSSPPHRECCRDPIGLQSCDFPIALGVAEWSARACFFSIVERPPHCRKSSRKSTVGTRRIYQKRAGPVCSRATACHLFVGIILCLHDALVPINAALHFLCLADSQCVMMYFPKWKVHNCQVWAVYVGTPLRPWCLSQIRNTMKSVDHRQLIAGESKWYDFQRTRRAWDWERARVRFWCFQCIFCTVRCQISSLTQSLWQNRRETTSKMNRAMSKPCYHALAFSDILLRLYLTFVPNLCGTDGQRWPVLLCLVVHFCVVFAPHMKNPKGVRVVVEWSPCWMLMWRKK